MTTQIQKTIQPISVFGKQITGVLFARPSIIPRAGDVAKVSISAWLFDNDEPVLPQGGRQNISNPDSLPNIIKRQIDLTGEFNTPEEIASLLGSSGLNTIADKAASKLGITFIANE